jgi:hypothetical protein
MEIIKKDLISPLQVKPIFYQGENSSLSQIDLNKFKKLKCIKN